MQAFRERKGCYFNIYLIRLLRKLSWNKMKYKHQSNIGVIEYFNAKDANKKKINKSNALYDWDIKKKCEICTFFVGILGDIEQSAFPYYTFPFEYLIISRYEFIRVCFVYIA